MALSPRTTWPAGSTAGSLAIASLLLCDPQSSKASKSPPVLQAEQQLLGLQQEPQELPVEERPPLEPRRQEQCPKPQGVPEPALALAAHTNKSTKSVWWAPVKIAHGFPPAGANKALVTSAVPPRFILPAADGDHTPTRIVAGRDRGMNPKENREKITKRSTAHSDIL